MTTKKLSYKEALAELEDILRQIENDEPDIDQLTEKVKRASYLLRYCQEKLHKTAAEVEDALKDVEENPEE
ncbi:MAG: exodeoxyribonuclease VII small subunit [Chlorobi bacterium]|nr:exodeoxyribonuclease VII small subunit [Chlorobiota bacterium]